MAALVGMERRVMERLLAGFGAPVADWQLSLYSWNTLSRKNYEVGARPEVERQENINNNSIG